MKTKRTDIPTPQELSKILKSMTAEQKMQLESIINITSALFIGIQQVAKSE